MPRLIETQTIFVRRIKPHCHAFGIKLARMFNANDRENNQMAQAAWKRSGSPIGKKGPRKVNPKYKRRAGEPWTTQEVRELRSLAKGNTPTGVISLKLQRPPAGIRSKAHREGISLRPVNRSPYNRASKSAKRRGR